MESSLSETTSTPTSGAGAATTVVSVVHILQHELIKIDRVSEIKMIIAKTETTIVDTLNKDRSVSFLIVGQKKNVATASKEIRIKFQVKYLLRNC
jgi:hypothetical protein